MAARRSSGRLLVIGGSEDRAGGAGLLRAFAEFSGGAAARIAIITTASGIPRDTFATYSAVFHRLGVPVVRELRLASQEQADDDRTLTELGQATGVFFTGGDQARLQVLVGSRTNRLLRDRLAGHAAVMAGTSASATVLGGTMILGGSSEDDADGSPPRTGPGLGLLPGAIVDMHFAERQRLPRLLAAVRQQPSHLGVGIDEDTAILVRPGRFDVLGRGTVTIADARTAAGPADPARGGMRLHRLHAGDSFSLHQRRPAPAEARAITRRVKQRTVPANNEIRSLILARQGLAPTSVPAPGQTVTLRFNANLSTGGTSKDVTDSVHPAVARMCARAAAVAGLDVCGIDLRLADISQPPTAGDAPGAVIEINSSPGLRMHLSPSEGRPRDIAGRIVDQLYPPGTSARVPIVSVTGTNGKTTTVRLIAHILRYAGLRVGMTSTDGVYLDGNLVHASDASGPRSAEMVLGDPSVQAAVLETARGGIVRRGLGYDRADVAVVANISGDHLGTDGIDTVDDLAAVKALVAEQIARGGQLVLNADDRRCAELAPPACRRGPRPGVPVLQPPAAQPGRDRPPEPRRHRLPGRGRLADRGGRFFPYRAGARGRRAAVVARAGRVHGRQRAGRGRRGPRARRADRGPPGRPGLVRARPDNPGRMDVFRIGQVPVVLDYAHNPAALSAVGRFVRQHWDRMGVAVLTLPGDRTDALVTESAYAVGCHFDRVVVYEDVDLRGREPGEMTKLISSALAEVRPGIRCEPAADLDEAVTLGLALAGPGDPLLVVYEKLGPVRSVLGRLGAQRPSVGQG